MYDSGQLKVIFAHYKPETGRDNNMGVWLLTPLSQLLIDINLHISFSNKRDL